MNTPSEAQSSLKNMPISFFSVVMGLAGTTIAWEKAQQVSGVHLGYLSEILLGIAGLVFIILIVMYSQKFIKYKMAVMAELQHPVKLSFFPTISISLLLLSIALIPINIGISQVLWMAGSLLHLIMVLYVISTWMHQSQFQIQHMSPAWFIPAVGNVIVPITGMSLGYVEISWFFFSIGMLFWVILLTIVFYRILFHDPIPARLLPTLFILIAPPAVGFVAYLKLTDGLDSFARILYYGGLFLTLLLLTQLRHFIKLPFSLAWWAYSFPISAITIASFAMYEQTEKVMFVWIAGGLLILLSSLVGLLSLRTLLAISHHEICTEEH